MGLVMSASMTVTTNVNTHGTLPRTICLICIVLMRMEAMRGVCVGCELYALLVRRGWVTKDEAYEVCAGGVCDIPVTRDVAPMPRDVTSGPRRRPLVASAS